MSGNLTPDTTLALMQAAQGDTARTVQKAKGINTANNKNMQKIEDAAREFEAVFIAEMMKPMFAGTELEAPFGGGKGEEVFRGMMLQEYGKIVSQTGGIGLADHVKEEMIRMQHAADGTTPLGQPTQGVASDE